jgi:hypothetical protein
MPAAAWPAAHACAGRTRSAPRGWEAVVADLAEKHEDELEVRVAELARNLRAPDGV